MEEFFDNPLESKIFCISLNLRDIFFKLNAISRQNFNEKVTLDII